MEDMILWFLLAGVFALGYFAADRLGKLMEETPEKAGPVPENRKKRTAVFNGEYSLAEITGAIRRTRERFGRGAVTVCLTWDAGREEDEGEKEPSVRQGKA